MQSNAKYYLLIYSKNIKEMEEKEKDQIQNRLPQWREGNRIRKSGYLSPLPLHLPYFITFFRALSTF